MTTTELCQKLRGGAMWDISLIRFHAHRALYGLVVVLVVAVVLGAVVGVSWRSEYNQCLANPGGFQKILAGTCAASLP
jgi:hypothetical protein